MMVINFVEIVLVLSLNSNLSLYNCTCHIPSRKQISELLKSSIKSVLDNLQKKDHTQTLVCMLPTLNQVAFHVNPSQKKHQDLKNSSPTAKSYET